MALIEQGIKLVLVFRIGTILRVCALHDSRIPHDGSGRVVHSCEYLWMAVERLTVDEFALDLCLPHSDRSLYDLHSSTMIGESKPRGELLVKTAYVLEQGPLDGQLVGVDDSFAECNSSFCAVRPGQTAAAAGCQLPCGRGLHQLRPAKLFE